MNNVEKTFFCWTVIHPDGREEYFCMGEKIQSQEEYNQITKRILKLKSFI